MHFLERFCGSPLQRWQTVCPSVSLLVTWCLLQRNCGWTRDGRGPPSYPHHCQEIACRYLSLNSLATFTLETWVGGRRHHDVVGQNEEKSAERLKRGLLAVPWLGSVFLLPHHDGARVEWLIRLHFLDGSDMPLEAIQSSRVSNLESSSHRSLHIFSGRFI